MRAPPPRRGTPALGHRPDFFGRRAAHPRPLPARPVPPPRDDAWRGGGRGGRRVEQGIAPRANPRAAHREQLGTSSLTTSTRAENETSGAARHTRSPGARAAPPRGRRDDGRDHPSQGVEATSRRGRARCSSSRSTGASGEGSSASAAGCARRARTARPRPRHTRQREEERHHAEPAAPRPGGGACRAPNNQRPASWARRGAGGGGGRNGAGVWLESGPSRGPGGEERRAGTSTLDGLRAIRAGGTPLAAGSGAQK